MRNVLSAWIYWKRMTGVFFVVVIVVQKKMLEPMNKTLGTLYTGGGLFDIGWVRASKGLMMHLPEPTTWGGWYEAIKDLIPELPANGKNHNGNTIRRKMAKLMIVETENSKAMEEFHNLKFIGQELRFPLYFGSVVNGVVQKALSVPGVFLPVWINLTHDSVVEAETKPLEEVITEAAQRRLR